MRIHPRSSRRLASEMHRTSRVHRASLRQRRIGVVTTVAVVCALGGGLASTGAFLAGNAAAPAAAPVTHTIFPATATPAVSGAHDARSVEVGVRFRPDVNGTATGVRFYKGTRNTGVHTGTLWAHDGTVLRRVTFTNETASGWQIATFAKPIALVPTTYYTLSYHAPVGHYAWTSNYFGKASDNGALHAFSFGEANGNGVYHYGAALTYPDLPAKTAGNYWVDITFVTGGTTPPTTAPPTTRAPVTTTVPGSTPTTTIPKTTTTIPKTTTTTIPKTTGWPTTGSTGAPASSTLTTYTGPTTITQCGTVIDHKIIKAPLTIRATNGSTAITNNEATSKANACVTLTNDLIAPTSSNCGAGCAGIDTSYSNGPACTVSGAAHPCGPVYVADTEISMPVSPSGFSYGFKETNIHAWRLYSHGTNQGGNCDGYCEFHDSYLVADHVDAQGTAHMDGLSSNGNGGRPILLDHDSLLCTLVNTGVSLSGGGCSGDLGLFGDFDPISNITVTNNLFLADREPAYCAYTGATQPSKAYPTGDHLVWKNNVWQPGTNGKCATYGPVADWKNGAAGNSWCNNIWSTTGQPVLSGGVCI